MADMPETVRLNTMAKSRIESVIKVLMTGETQISVSPTRVVEVALKTLDDMAQEPDTLMRSFADAILQGEI